MDLGKEYLLLYTPSQTYLKHVNTRNNLQKAI